MRTKVVLHGAIAAAVGRAEWFFCNLASPVEAIRAIEANGGKIMNYFRQHLHSEYRIVVDDKDAGIDDMQMEREFGTVHIMPIIKGSGNTGGILALIGIAIIALVLAIPTGGGSIAGAGSGWAALFGPAASSISLTTAQAFFLTAGIAITVSGIAQMLTPTNKVDTTERPENKASYLYNGAVNTYRQGNPVPFGAGIMRVGSQVISAGIRSVDVLD